MRYIKATMLAIAAVLLAGALAPPARAGVSFDVAYSNLSHHGSWMVSAQYGRVWQPREYNRGWNPYYDGHWANTDLGWSWVSDYEWGAIPYHYGTWVADPLVGWVWIPGNTWAPSWVTFRTGPNYIGWAPVPPGYSIGASIGFGGGSSSFVFVSSRDFLAPRLRVAIIPEYRSRVFVNNTTVVNNISIQNNVVINRGPDVRMVERATGHRVNQQRIENVARVSPYSRVDRGQFAVDPERARRGGVRASEQIPESQPLPRSYIRGSRGRDGTQGDVLQGQNDRRAIRTTHQGTSSRTAPMTQGRAEADARMRAEQSARAQQGNSGPQQENPRVRAPRNARQQHADAKAKADARGKRRNQDRKDQHPGKDGSERPAQDPRP